MSRRLLTLVVTAGLVAGTTAVAVPAAGAPAAPASSATVVLPTGQQVIVTQTAHGYRIGVPPAAQSLPGSRMTTLVSSGHAYALPEAAGVYLGKVLDPDLFDLAKLRPAAAAGRLAVDLRYTGSRPSIPGLTWTGSSTGYLPLPAGAAAFGKAAAADRLPANLLHMSLAGDPPVVQPNFLMQTLTIRGINAAGKKDTGDFIAVMNVDNASKFFGFAAFNDGVVKFSVPVGHYIAVANFFPTNGSWPVVVLPQFSVSRDTTVTADARTATVSPSVALPRPASYDASVLTVLRSAAVEGSYSSTSIDYPSELGVHNRFLITPTAPVTVGALHYDTYWHYSSPTGTGAPYTYDLDFPARGAIPADQDHRVSDAQLASVTARYTSDVANQPAASGHGVAYDLGGGSWETYTVNVPFTAPLTRTEYLSADPDVIWQSDFWRNASFFAGTDELIDAPRTYTPGQRSTETWAGQPIVPGPQIYGRPIPVPCTVCRQENTLDLTVMPFTDSDGHAAGLLGLGDGSAETTTGAWRLDSGGTQLGGGSGLPIYTEVAVPADPSTYQLTYSVSHTAPWLTLSTATSTTWTFDTASGAGSPAPAGYFCLEAGDCRVQPLLFVHYDLPTTLAGTEPGGQPTSASFSVTHLPGAPASPPSHPAFQVSFDGGTTWTAAQVSAIGNGSYTASYTNPPAADSDGYAAIKVEATDQSGSRISQTVTRAYALS